MPSYTTHVCCIIILLVPLCYINTLDFITFEHTILLRQMLSCDSPCFAQCSYLVYVCVFEAPVGSAPVLRSKQKQKKGFGGAVGATRALLLLQISIGAQLKVLPGTAQIPCIS